jgi:hypothetical protein
MRWINFLGLCLLANSSLLDELDAKHRFIAQDKQTLSIVDKLGQVEWQMKFGPIHDLHQLEGGEILTHQKTKLVILRLQDKSVVWEFDCKQLFPKTKIEVHSFIPKANGEIIVAISGAGKVVTINREGEVLHSFKMKLLQPHFHKDTRLMRLTPEKTLLISHEGDGHVREYTQEGKLLWDYEVPMFGKSKVKGHGLSAFGNSVFSAVRLKNGNTLICTGNGHSIIEVTPDKKIVWHLKQNDLKNIQLAWVTTIEVLPNGNLVLGNCHAGPENPQLVEITRDKKIIWSYRDFKNFGNALSNSLVLSQYGQSIR